MTISISSIEINDDGVTHLGRTIVIRDWQCEDRRLVDDGYGESEFSGSVRPVIGINNAHDKFTIAYIITAWSPINYATSTVDACTSSTT